MMAQTGAMRVGFVGLGTMGRPMAGHILRAGFPLTVNNRTHHKTEALAQAGASVAVSPAEVARNSEVIIIMVSDTPDVEEVVMGPQGIMVGLAAGLAAGAVVVDMSTIDPHATRRLAARLREAGGDWVDAPVSGGDVGAKNATLAIMAGGRDTTIARVRPVLQTMGTVTHCGAVGCGQVTKLCNQILVSTNLAGVCEALGFARKNGLDPSVMIDAVSGGAAASWQLANLAPRVVAGDYRAGFAVDLMAKDLGLVARDAARQSIPLPVTTLVQQFFAAARAEGLGKEGTQALAKVLQRLMG